MRVEIVTINPTPRRTGPRHHPVEVAGEVRKVEMAVMVDEHIWHFRCARA
jgi:hypothetical protein